MNRNLWIGYFRDYYYYFFFFRYFQANRMQERIFRYFKVQWMVQLLKMYIFENERVIEKDLMKIF